MKRRAVYPGSFNPPTVAHHDVSAAVRKQRNVDVVVWSLSVSTLGKDAGIRPTIEERAEVLRRIAVKTDWLEVQVTEAGLLSEIADGFDVVVMGADKWEQINEVQWYGDDPDARDEAIAALPEIAVAPRPPHPTPAHLQLDLSGVERVSSTAARNGADHLILPLALESGLWQPER